MRADVVVVGGGISGLAAAYRARNAGASVILLEALASVGGVMQTDDHNGFVVERGPTSMAATAQTMQLMDELGLTSDVVPPPESAKRRYILRDGTMHALPSSPSSLFRSDLLSPLGKLRVLAEPFVRRSTNIEHEESLAAFVRRRFGQEALDYFVDPFVSGMCAGDPERLSSQHVLRAMSEFERESGSVLLGAVKRARQRRGKAGGHIVSLKGGMNQLPRAFQRALDGACLLGARLTRVEPSGNRLELACDIGGVCETVQADSLVCALPAHILPSIDWPAAWHDNLERLSAVTYAPVCTVAMGFRRADVAHPLDGFGVLIPSAEKRSILGALFNTSMFDGRAPSDQVLITAFVGGARSENAAARSVVEQPPYAGDACVRAALSELTPLLGISGAPIMTKVTCWERGIPQLEVGHHRVVRAALAIENDASRVFFTGSYLSGAAIGDCLEHGALAGDRAAAVALRRRGNAANILADLASAVL